GDYDNDGDLDIILSGEKGSLRIAKVFRNEILTHNTKPGTPQGLTMAENSGNTVLSWDAVTDTETPSKGLSYNVRVGTGSGGSQVMSSMAANSGVRYVTSLGNTQLKTSYILKNLKPGTYYWSVQAVDNIFAGGQFGLEKSFSVDSIQASRLEGKLVRTDNSALSLKWVNGNGERRVVFCKQGSSGTAYPLNNKTYRADPVFGSGDQIGTSGWYCIYSGRDDSTTVVGLSQGISYSFQVFEFIGNTGAEIFYRTTGVANPGIFSCGLFSDQTDLGLTGVYNSAVSWGDYDNDGDLDVLLSGYTGSTPVSKIFRNNGNNSFTEQTGINLFGVQNSTAAFGDYDNDGDLDILLTGTATGAFPVSKIYRNNGSNSFTEQFSISLTGVNFSSAAWGDYDNDGYIDILITGQGAGSTYVSKVYRNNGDGTFAEQTSIILAKISRGTVSWTDHDNDGDLDIFLTGNAALGTQSSVIKIYQNKGNNEFTEQSGLNITGVYNSSAAWGDYDNDSDLDLLLAGYYNDGAIRFISRVYRNNGDNTFTWQTGFNLDGVANSSVAWGDFDNDGDLDILLTGRLVSGVVISKIYSNNNNNTFSEVTDITLSGVGYSSARWGDYDNDGDLDILLSGQGSGTTAITKIYRNNYLMKAGNYPANKTPSAPGYLKSVAVPEGMKLTWSPLESDETVSATMSYNLIIKTLQDGLVVSPSHSDTINGYRRIVAPGNAMLDTSFIVKNLTPGKYLWKVQGVDQGYKGGEWSEWNTFEAKNIRAFFSADTVCEGLETHFVNNSTSVDEPITSYSWDFGDGGTSSLPNPSYIFKTSGVHNVRLAVSSASNSDTLIQQVIVYPSPKAEFSATIACQGQETVLENLTPVTGITITSWSWDFGDGKGSVQKDPGRHGYLSAGDYSASLVAVSADACSDTVKHTVQVGAIPLAVINASSPSLSFCSGDSISLTVAYDTGYTYQWMSGGLTLPGQDSSKYVAKSTGTYSVKVVNLTGNCISTSSDAIVSVRPNPIKPVISSVNYTENQCPPIDKEVRLFLTPEVAGYSYQWIKNGIPQTGGNQPFIQGYLDQGDYTVESYLNECKSVSDNYNIKYAAAPDKPKILVKGPVVWYMATEKNTYKYYKWYHEDILIQGASKYLYVANKTLGTYRVEVADDQCYTKSDPVTIPVDKAGMSDFDIPSEYMISEGPVEFENLNIYPNPTKGPVQYEIDNMLWGDVIITILTIDGKEISKQKVRKDFDYLIEKIDLSGYDRGNYLIKFELNNAVVIKKIILE
ncbi:MAG: VCBS repeat-containing protein, partial [Bacteroidia bacterium]|nr:VCBS repeat-containing protein [Bacteroidia bacterium]